MEKCKIFAVVAIAYFVTAVSFPCTGFENANNREQHGLQHATGRIVSTVSTNGTTWYVSAGTVSGDTVILYAGAGSDVNGTRAEVRIGEITGFQHAGSIQVRGTAMFFLVEKQGGSLLYHVDCNSEKVDMRTGVLDFQLIHGIPVMIEEGEGRQYHLRYDQKDMPLYMDEKPRFSRLVDDRLLHITDGVTVEIVDTATWKYVYRYTHTSTPVTPVEYNCILEIRDADTDAASLRERIFYKVFSDGNEDGRTIAASRATPVTYKLELAPSTIHSIIIERWELHKSSGRYRRANNIRQPDALLLYVPADRVIKVVVDYNGREYRIRREILMQP